jgi:Kef-type K+ transport system membrane component KefB
MLDMIGWCMMVPIALAAAFIGYAMIYWMIRITWLFVKPVFSKKGAIAIGLILTAGVAFVVIAESAPPSAQYTQAREAEDQARAAWIKATLRQMEEDRKILRR